MTATTTTRTEGANAMEVRTEYCPFGDLDSVAKWLRDGNQLPTHDTSHPAHCRAFAYGFTNTKGETAGVVYCADCAEREIRNNAYLRAMFPLLILSSFHSGAHCEYCGHDLSNDREMASFDDYFVPMTIGN